jgi:hypothetical protein
MTRIINKALLSHIIHGEGKKSFVRFSKEKKKTRKLRYEILPT